MCKCESLLGLGEGSEQRMQGRQGMLLCLSVPESCPKLLSRGAACDEGSWLNLARCSSQLLATPRYKAGHNGVENS